jgi:hypothetical protein
VHLHGKLLLPVPLFDAIARHFPFDKAPQSLAQHDEMFGFMALWEV